MKIQLNDKVMVTAGKYKGKTGTVMKVFKKTERVTVEKVNIRTKHVKKTAQGAGQKIKYEAPIHVSNVMLVDPKTNKPTRVGYRVENNKKVRFAKKSGQTIEKNLPSKK